MKNKKNIIYYINTLIKTFGKAFVYYILAVLFIQSFIFMRDFIPFLIIKSDKHIEQSYFQKSITLIIVKQPFDLISDIHINGYPAFRDGEVLLSNLYMTFYENLHMEVTRTIICEDRSPIYLEKVSKTIPAGNYWEKPAVSTHNVLPYGVHKGVPCELVFDTVFNGIHKDIVKTEKFIVY